MANVVFAVPFALPNTVQFARIVAALPGIRLGIVSQEPAERLPPDLRGQLQGFQQVGDALDADQLTDAVTSLGRQLGSVDRLFGVLEQAQEAMAEVRQRLGITGMTLQTARNFRDKARMKDVLRAHDLPCARHALAGSAEEALAFARVQGFPLVVKPPDGAGAKATVRVENVEQLQGYLASAPARPDRPVLLEEFVVGHEFSFDSICVDGRHVFHSISDYHPTPLDVLRNPWIQWCVILPRDVSGGEYEPIRQAGPAALEALGMVTGMSHLEWFRRPDGSIAISEVAARPPGAQFMTLLSYAHDFDFYRAWAGLMVFDQFAPPERRYAAGAAYLRGQGSGKVVAIHGLEQAQREVGELIVEAKLPMPGQAPAGSYEGEGFVVVRHPDTAVVERALQTLVSTLRVELG